MKLNIVSFDVPWPANYGGVIDVYNRLEALHNAGISIILHAFDYGRGPASKLDELCQEVHYYRRKSRLLTMIGSDPMIVSSRSNDELLNNLEKNDYPILFEGQHTTAFLDHPGLNERIKLVRIHNIEHEYYAALGKSTKELSKRLYFQREAKKLKDQEKKLSLADHLLCLTQNDTSYYQERFKNASYLPVAINCKYQPQNKSKNKFALYHGNLSVEENKQAVDWILTHVCSEVDIQFIIAGKDPDKKLTKRIKSLNNVELVASPSDKKMCELLINAHVHVLYTEQSTGIKLKLLNALCTEAPIVCNQKMVKGTGLDEACIIANDAQEMTIALDQLIDEKPPQLHEQRTRLLKDHSYQSHAKKLIQFLQ